MSKQQKYTRVGFEALERELRELKLEQEKNKKEISEARAYGDLSENSEYDEAKTTQAKLAMQVAELEEKIKNAVVVEDDALDEVIGVGSTVRVHHVERDKDIVYHIVGSYEADPLSGKISDVSPIGQALVGTRYDAETPATVTVTAPHGEFHLRVLEVKRTEA